MAATYKIKPSNRPQGVRPITTEKEWLTFLTSEGLYDKTIRTLEEAKSSGKKYVIYPDIKDITQFYAYSGVGNVLIHLHYDITGYLNELKESSFLSEEQYDSQIILIPELKKALGIQTGGRRRSRRRSRKAKKNKAHTPQ